MNRKKLIQYKVRTHLGHILHITIASTRTWLPLSLQPCRLCERYVSNVSKKQPDRNCVTVKIENEVNE